MAGDSPQREGISRTLLAFLALVPAIATAITGFLAWQVNSEVESVRVELNRIESQRAFDLEIYRAVKEALTGSAKDQQVALALVVSIGQEPASVADGAQGRIRARPLSARKNREPMYRIDGYALCGGENEAMC